MLSGKFVVSGGFVAILGLFAEPAFADCSKLPGQAALKSALTSSLTAGGSNHGANGGLGFNMWGTIVDESGIVCAVAFTGANVTYQWLASRVISAQKANTANSLSLGTGATPAGSDVGTAGLALPTANLYSAVQPGGSLYGLQHSNPVETDEPTATPLGVPGIRRPTLRPSAQRAIRWSASALEASMCSAAASDSIVAAA
jgi:hypothetical protein